MAKLRPGDVDAYLARPKKTAPVILIFGPDSGLVRERAEKLIAALDVDTGDPFSSIRLDADAAAADPARLSDEANTVSMFGGERLVRVTGTTSRNLAAAVAPLLDAPPRECWVVVEAGDLRPDSALRRSVEKSDCAVAIPCYRDDARSLGRLIDEELTQKGITLDRDSKAWLRDALGKDRQTSRNELRKIALYAGDRKTIEFAELTALVGDAGEFATTELIDAAACGETGFLQTAFDRVVGEGTPPDMIVLSGLRHMQLLHSLRAKLDGGGESPSNLVRSVRPRIHFSREDKVVRALALWSLEPLAGAMERLERSVLEARARRPLAGSIAATALLAVALQARRMASARH